MEIVSEITHKHFLLVVLLPLQLADTSTAHLFLIALLIILRLAGSQNYCNAAVSLLILPITFFQNIETAT